jgi:hypothetical protein
VSHALAVRLQKPSLRSVQTSIQATRIFETLILPIFKSEIRVEMLCRLMCYPIASLGILGCKNSPGVSKIEFGTLWKTLSIDSSFSSPACNLRGILGVGDSSILLKHNRLISMPSSLESIGLE